MNIKNTNITKNSNATEHINVKGTKITELEFVLLNDT